MGKFFIFRKGRDVTLYPSAPVRASLIWVHGLGDSAQKWAQSFLTKNIAPAGVKVVLPTAPTSPVSKNNGEVMTSWFDIKINAQGQKEYNFRDAEENAKRLREQVRAEVEELKNSQRVFIGGFSQGAAMSLNIGLNSEEHLLGGVIALSGFAFPQTKVSAATPPVLACHGEQDDVIPLDYSLRSMQRLSHLPNFCFIRVPNLKHKFNADVSDAVFNFLTEQLIRQTNSSNVS